jgi:hypothetical protein
MWGAVYNFGPRWGANIGRRGPVVTANEETQNEFMRRLDAWIVRSNPPREEIARAIDAGIVPQ